MAFYQKMIDRQRGWLAIGLLLTLLVVTTPVWGASYFVYQQWGGTWQDANKTSWNTEDDLMCWAAAASNVLTWGGWGTATYNTTDKAFKHFQDHWTDNVGYIWIGYKYWFDGSTSPYSTLSVVDVPGGGNFYPTLNFSEYYSGSSRGNLMASIDAMMRKGYGIGLTISNGSAYSHAVTAWGFDYYYDAVLAAMQYTAVYITDSDDGILGLRKYPLELKDGKWYLSGNYSGWRVTNYQALKKRSTTLINASSFLDTGLNAAGVAPVPVPSTLVLVATGGLLLLWRRKRQQ